jgi:hydroxymethylglutaryl-CoA lyase
MAGTAEVLSLIDPIPNTDLSVLIPNGKGLDEVFRILSASISPDSAAKPPPPVTEVAIFTAATDAFSRANTNVTVSDSLARLEPVARAAREKGLKVRGYVSVIITCPYSGRVDPRRVRDVSRELLQMGCYEVSLGDTTGTGTPASVRAVLEEVCKEIDPSRLAGHFHDTNGTALANIFTALDVGLRSFDASVGGLGGCPYSPGATGNVATEDVVYALTGESLYGDIREPYTGQPISVLYCSILIPHLVSQHLHVHYRPFWVRNGTLVRYLFRCLRKQALGFPRRSEGRTRVGQGVLTSLESVGTSR